MAQQEHPDEKIIILTAPSGAGKTTIAHELLRQLSELSFTVSVTSRPPREGEIEGKDYYFVSLEDFKKKIAEEAFIEHEKVYKGKYYGTLHSELERIWKHHKYPLRVVDVKGAKKLKSIFRDQALSVFIKPPSIDILEQRLRKRGYDSEEELAERMNKATEEMKSEKAFDLVVLNKDLKPAIEELRKAIQGFIYG